ncbi:MAG: hypothetical protein HRU10_09460 [Opitutales bacterium]|nr:hypothetical protein [Opitutales bacterium]
MAKIDTETLKLILQRNLSEDPGPRKINDILQDVNQELQQQEAEKEDKPPAVKKQFCIVITDPNRTLEPTDLVGWVVQIPQGDSPLTAPDRIIEAAYDYNQTPKGRRLPLETIGEACEVVSAKFFKEQEIWVKTKMPVQVVVTANRIPREGGSE